MTSPAAVSSPTHCLSGKRILVVEDEPLIGMVVEDLLLELGAEVVGPACTIDQATRLIEGTEIDAAVLDVNLAGISSEPVARILRERSVPFVFATGYERPDVPGFETTPVARKPFVGEQLATLLSNALG